MAGDYFGYFIKWFTDFLSNLGQWFNGLTYKVTHDPYWAGGAFAVVVVIAFLIYLKRRTSR